MSSINEVVSPRLVPSPGPGDNELAVMLTGGGARAAYQVGLLRGIAKHFPNVRFDIITGVSAGAINAALLAAYPGTLADKSDELSLLWSELQCHDIFRFDMTKLVPFRNMLASVFPKKRWSRPGGIFDTTPLRNLLQGVLGCKPRQPIEGIIRNVRDGNLNAVALMTLDYNTGQTVRWVQGRNFDVFEGPNRRSAPTQLTIEHVLASAALPFVFPAVRIGTEWHGDGGIRLAAPLSAPVHLGARRILAMSTGYQRTTDEANTPVVTGYPPAAQIINQLVNAIFLDVIDEDVLRMERMNEMLRKLDPSERNGFKPIDLLVLRPSRDLGKLAADYEKNLPRNLKLLVRALGSGETESPDFVSLLLFEPNYICRLIDLGEEDVEARVDELRPFFGAEDVTEAAAG